MALNTCPSLGYIYDDDFCVPVGVKQEQDEFTINKGWIAGAFFLGLILGAGLVALLTKPFLAAWEKKKRQDEEELLEATGKSSVVEARAVNGWVDAENEKQKLPKVEKGKKIHIKGSRFWRRKKSAGTTKEGGEIKDGDVDPALSRGMVDVMQQTNSTSAEVEMADQDMSTIVSMESSMEEEKETMLLKTLAMLLKKKMEKKMITQNFYMNFMKKTEEEVKDLSKMINREKEEAEQKLQSDPKLSKDSQAMETEMQKLQTHYNNKQSKLQRDYRDKIRLNLLRSSGMSEAEVDDTIAKLMNNMAMVEEKLGLEQARQRRALEQRLAKRRQAVEFKEMEAKEIEKEKDTRVNTLNNLLETQLKDSNRLEQQKDQILTEYDNDLDVIRKYHAKELHTLQLEKSDILKLERLKKFFKLSKKQEKEKAAMVQQADKTTNTTEFIKAFHDLMTRHHMEQEALCDELDQLEMRELHKIKQDVSKAEKHAMDKETEKLVDNLEVKANLQPSEAERIIKLHKAEMADLEGKRNREKQAMMARLQERLQQRLAAADEAEARDQKEQEVLKEEQMATMSKVLTTNMDLTQDAKERVLKEHEQNMQALSNQLLRSKLRQQKSLEIKLNQRKARLAQLKQQQEELENSRKQMKEQEKEQLAAKLAADIAKEEESFEEARKTAVAELRRQLAQETEEALKLQDEEIGLLIGRLQVGQARRRAILDKQDETLKQLQDQLEKRVESGQNLPTSVTDQILQQHNQNVQYLSDQLQRRKEKQEKIIMDKINAKKNNMEQVMEVELEQDAQSEYTEQQKRGAGYASLALMQSFLEQKHAKATQELEVEMLAELERSKSDLNQEMELNLKKELEDQKKTMLSQLAEVSKMSSRDLNDAYSAAEAGRKYNYRRGDTESKAAKRLAEDMREVRAKTSMSKPYDNGDGLGFRRANTDLMNQSQGFEYRQGRKGSAASRPASSKRNPRPAFVDEDDDTDDGF